MIDDPIVWQGELVDAANRLEAKTKQIRWADRTGHLIERDFVLAAYAMRKVLASDVEPRQRRFPVRRFDHVEDVGSCVDIADWYDLDNGRRAMLSVAELCHEITQNVVFVFCCGETDDLFDGIYVAADGTDGDFLYLVLASDFIALCLDIAGEEGA